MRRWLLLSTLLVGCLPEDTRDPPGMLTVTIRGADATVDGLTTSDGWRVTFDRVRVAVGAPDLTREGNCSPYSDGEYLRVIDGLRREPEKLGSVYGLGSCGLQLRAGNPGPEALLGAGVTEADVFAMREPGSDGHVEDAGITFSVRGHAERGAERKTFDWSYRRRFLHYEGCKLPQPLELTANASVVVEVRVHAAALFDDAFGPYALADENGDGAITLEELDRAPSADTTKTLGAVLYDDRFPRIIRIGENVECAFNVERFGDGPR